MSKKTISTAILIGGVLLVGVSLLADTLNIGVKAGFGSKQTIGLVVGLAAALVGLWMLTKKEK